MIYNKCEFMLHRYYLIIVILGFVLFESCSKQCLDTYDLERIIIFNYKITDLDNVIIKSYKKDDNFQTLIDSFNIIKLENSSDVGLYESTCLLNRKLSPNYDFDIYFKDIDRHCPITKIKIKKLKCSNGLFLVNNTYSFEEYYVYNLVFKCQILKACPYDY